MPVAITRPPRSEIIRAVHLPIPEEAPDTRNVEPVSEKGSSFILHLDNSWAHYSFGHAMYCSKGGAHAEPT